MINCIRDKNQDAFVAKKKKLASLEATLVSKLCPELLTGVKFRATCIYCY